MGGGGGGGGHLFPYTPNRLMVGTCMEIISRNVKSAYPSKIVTGFWEGYER